MTRRGRTRLVTRAAMLLSVGLLITAGLHPARGEPWKQYATPEDAGFDAAQVERVRGLAEKAGSAAVMLVYRGSVVVAWGEVERPYECHSVRKSLVSALVGVYVGDGTIDLAKSLAELGIDDKPPLTEEEKSARLIDLIRSRSGIDHPAAKEPADVSAERPSRWPSTRPSSKRTSVSTWASRICTSPFVSFRAGSSPSFAARATRNCSRSRSRPSSLAPAISATFLVCSSTRWRRSIEYGLMARSTCVLAEERLASGTAAQDTSLLQQPTASGLSAAFMGLSSDSAGSRNP